jgi:hypothetical protein
MPILLFVIIAATASTYNQQPTVSMGNATMLHPTLQQTSDEQADEATTEINDTMIHGWATANQTLQHDESLPRTPTVPQEFLPTSVRRPAPKSPYFLHYVPKKGKRKKHANTTATLSHKKPHIRRQSLPTFSSTSKQVGARSTYTKSTHCLYSTLV